MARFSTSVASESLYLEEATTYLLSEGFQAKMYKGESVFKKGVGLMQAPQFVKLLENGDEVIVEAWIKYPLLPGVYIGEMGLSGFFGAIPKKNLKRRVNRLLEILNA